MPLESGSTENNISECLEHWKSENEIWGDLTGAMRHQLKLRLEEIMEASATLRYPG